jgi:CubicO group peptidase (beta-lactamase class C family)
MYFSISKTIISVIIGILEQQGRLSTADPLGKYLPQLHESDWADIRIVDVLNMCTGMTGLQFDDPEAQTDTSNVYFRFASHMGLAPRTSAGSNNIWIILKTMRKQKKAGTAYEYSSVNTVLLTLLAEEVTGMRFADLVSGYIWRHIGAESDAYVGLSPDGLASSSAMVSGTLRDLARYGLLFSPSWSSVCQTKVIPDSYFTQLHHNGAAPAAYDKGLMGAGAIRDLKERPDHNAWQWDGVMTDGDFFKSGTHGQCLYISPSRDLVIACFAHDPGSNIGWARAIARSGLFAPQSSSSNK